MSRWYARRHHGGSGLGVLLLLGEVLRIGTNNIPPVTLAVVALNAAIYLGFLRAFLPFLPHVNNACSSNILVFDNKQYYRLLTSSFYHLDDMHLYYNMVSFILKGRSLETRYGGRKFLIMIITFALSTQLVMLGLNKMLAVVLLDQSYLMACAAGFSAVIFALKVVTTHHMSGSELLLGMFPVPARYACWAELVVIQILVPNASFTGHLAGILVGIAFVRGPLKKVVKFISKIVRGKYWSTSQRRFRPQSGRSGEYGEVGQDDGDEDLQEAIRQSLRYGNEGERGIRQPPSYGWSVYGDDPSRRSSGGLDSGATYSPSRTYDSRNQGPSGGAWNSRGEPSSPFNSYQDPYQSSYGYPQHPSSNSWTMSPPPYSSPALNERDGYVHEHITPPQYSESDEVNGLEDLRRARLRRFQNR